MRFYGDPDVAVHSKPDLSPVTAADEAANVCLERALRAAFPEDAFLSEESPDDEARLARRRVWIVDPLDGTRDFLAQTGDFCVLVGLNGSSASSVTTQGETVVPKFLARNGPSGTYSHFWISRALQSLTRTMPKRCAGASPTGTGRPSSLPGPTKTPISNSKSRLRLGPKVGAGASSAFVWPRGRCRWARRPNTWRSRAARSTPC